MAGTCAPCGPVKASSKRVTWYTFPPLPPLAYAPAPYAEGNAFSCASDIFFSTVIPSAKLKKRETGIKKRIRAIASLLAIALIELIFMFIIIQQKWGYRKVENLTNLVRF